MGEDHTPGRLLAEEKKPKRKFCNTTTYALKGDYAYEACGAFCKQAKAANHCKFCKCKACSFCASAAATSKAPVKAVNPDKALRKEAKKAKKEAKKLGMKPGKGKGGGKK